jgi:hypothetical protein
LRKDLRAQSTAMQQTFDDLLSGEALQVTAWLAQTDAVGFDVADLEIASDQVVQCDPARDQIAARLGGREFHVVVTLQRFDSFGFDQG